MKKLFLLIALLVLTVSASAQTVGTPSNPFGGDIRASSAACATAASCVWQKLPSTATTLTATITGTFVATLQFEQSSDGITFVAASPASTSTTGVTTFTVTSFTDFRVRASAYVSGMASVSLQASGNQLSVTVNSAGSSISPNSPIPQAQVGPGFNVKNYGAKGDTQATGNTACTFIGGNAQFTCTGVTFSSATDAAKNLFCSSSNGGASFFGNSLQTIISVQNATTATASTTSGFSASGGCIWGTIDDTAISAAITAAKAANKALNGVGNVGIIAASPRVYFPAGGYFVCTLLATGMVNLSSTSDAMIIEGDGLDQTFLYPGGGTACPNGGATSGSFFTTASGSTNVSIGKLTIDGVNGQNSQAGIAMAIAGGAHLYDIQIQRWAAGFGLYLTGQNIQGERLVVVGGQSVGVQCEQCNAELRGGGSSNNGTNLIVKSVVGLNTGEGFRWFGGLIDECGTNPTACTQVINSQDVWFIGMAGFGTPNASCLNVDPTSFVHWSGGICGVFGTDTNTSGATIQAGGILQASDVRFVSSGTGKCVNNSGTLNDNGGNSCESMFRITSGTSTGTTAVLTLVNAGAAVNTNCSIGDALQVEGAGIAGYNGYFAAGAITATSPTTLTYTTIGSNLGALSAGGVAHCRNLQTFTGNLPKALLNIPTTNTCYVAGTFGATVTGAPMCNARIPAATNIQRITAASTTVTACTVAPVVTISDGTASITLTITTVKSQWDSSVDASTGVGTTIFKPNGTLQVTNTAGTCTTPPTNFSVSYNPTPILSN